MGGKALKYLKFLRAKRLQLTSSVRTSVSLSDVFSLQSSYTYLSFFCCRKNDDVAFVVVGVCQILSIIASCGCQGDLRQNLVKHVFQC